MTWKLDTADRLFDTAQPLLSGIERFLKFVLTLLLTRRVAQRSKGGRSTSPVRLGHAEKCQKPWADVLLEFVATS